MDVFTEAQRHWVMSRVRQKDTEPELITRRVLHSNGYRYCLHAKSLPGSPDIVLPKYHTVVLVHGCFWHGHGCRRGLKRPKSNAVYWDAKLARNMRRDVRVERQLRRSGWHVITVWECQTKDPEKLSSRLCRILKK